MYDGCRGGVHMSDDFMGGMFDFNGDGKTDLGEEYIAYKIYEDCTKDVGS